MGVGGLLSAQAELSHYNFMSKQTATRVSQSCFGEMEREVCAILEPFGVPTEIGAMVAAKLQSVEVKEYQQYTEGEEVLPAPVLSPASAPAPPRVRSDGLVGPERGLTPFLLRLGEGLEKIESSRVWQSALIIGASYFIGGFIPLLPYILVSDIRDALFLSIGVTGIVLLLFGVVKQVSTGGQTDIKGLLYGALSTLFVGAAAAGSSWAIVRALEGNMDA
jgi:VIT1/CCC1 family predicted Fe2+/Mn2+ transporter